jgi:HSP20 family protein
MSERRFGSFQRALRLPDGVDESRITADLRNGVLTVTMPKSAEASKQRKVEIKKAA